MGGEDSGKAHVAAGSKHVRYGSASRRLRSPEKNKRKGRAGAPLLGPLRKQDGIFPACQRNDRYVCFLWSREAAGKIAANAAGEPAMLGSLSDSLLDDALRVRLRSNLAAFDRHAEAAPGLRPAAVAIVLVPDEEGRAAFLLTRRAPRLRSHGGQWALPGGRLDTGESPEAAALRELREELGLVLEPTSVLGLLDDYPTRSGFMITPVVLWGEGASEPCPNPREVASVHRVSVAELARPDVPRLRSIPESDRPVISIPLLGTQIHAPTAALLYQLVEVAFRGRDTRVAHFEQPVFAWR